MNNSQTNDSNPCCSGQWSRTAEKDSYQPGERVLILVVVEDGLVRFDVDIETLQNYGS